MRTIIVNTSIDRRRKDLKLQLNMDLDHAEPLADRATSVDNLNAQDILNLMQGCLQFSWLYSIFMRLTATIMMRLEKCSIYRRVRRGVFKQGQRKIKNNN